MKKLNMKKKNEVVLNKKPRWKLLHQYYNYTGFYKFVGNSLKKAILPVLLFLAALFAINEYVININSILVTVTETYSPVGILAVFLASESIFLGLVPPELFIAWSGKSAMPITYLSLLALASYLGGIISYWMGKAIKMIPAVHDAMETKMAKHIKNTEKWGGFLIVVGALLPIPFSITSVAAGIINYKFRYYLLFGLLRFIRFYGYALVIFKIV
ncbi:VTT domain-containing protein [Salinimicrobium sp. MT39]|uniref:VTT domain-containing protein n=1 Tax=Salinimicrobium profundisediminis TaxID=2994553 RepID=A0A9X3CVD2_9FLAO|nr:VTT domain-containing protein [Salinimicrobium profundisediminis]MCX2837359.1 VTT domain-containing protein [Salinimicrobium profundisediminis]